MREDQAGSFQDIEGWRVAGTGVNIACAEVDFRVTKYFLSGYGMSGISNR